MRPLCCIDLFAGGGGASEGIRRALGVAPFLAVNHDPAAIAMHAANHPRTIHLCKSVYAVSPRASVGRRAVDLLWASPDCTHFSRAKGGRPRKREIRDLAWVVIEWAEAVRPRVICLENVPEFQTWGPLDELGQPIRERSGETFRLFVGRLGLLGYRVEWRVLCAADYGAPTSRRRLFLVARRDQEAICWPEPTHGPGRLQAWRTAAECIDWTLPCPSIFERSRPLADATQRRIAEGIRRFVLGRRPFLVRIGQTGGNGSYVNGLDAPLTTITSKPEHCLVSPSLVNLTHGARVEDLVEPMRTVTAAHRGEKALVAASLIHHRGRSIGREVDAPAPTVTATFGGHLGLMAASLIQAGWGEREGQAPRVLDIEVPLGTVVSGGPKHALVAAFLARHNGTTPGRENAGADLRGPCSTVTGRDTHGLAAVFLDKLHGSAQAGQDIDQPAPTVAAGGGRGGGHAALVAAFLARYYGQGGQWSGCDQALPTILSRDRFALVLVELDGEPYVLSDIGLRMLQPRELARAQGFQDSYLLTGTKAEQVARIGNSVPPDVVAALVRAQFNPEQSAVEAA